MSKNCLLIGALILMACHVARGEDAKWTQWQNSLKPVGTPGAQLTIVENGESKYSIATPGSATTEEKKAAEDLQHWIAEMTGTKLKVTAKAPGPVISIATKQDFASEQYEISVDGESIRLTGGPGRGVVNAVYALLEEDVGCRWYAGDGATLPHSKTLMIAPVARNYVPRLRERDPFWKVAFDGTWSLRNRTNAPDAAVPEEFGGHIDFGKYFVHTAANLLPPGKYFKDHPEYFMLDKAGKRQPAQWCPTEPAVAKIVTQAVLDALKASPHTEIISVSKNDSGGDQLCQCERCKKLRDEEGGAEMATQLFLVNQVAEAVEKQYPKVAIDTLAYLDTIAVPKTVRPRKNVVIRLCNDTVGAWGHPFTPADQLPVAKIAQAWSAVHDRIYIWDYHVNFSHYFAPMPNIEVIAANIRFWVKNNAEGVMLQAAYNSIAERDQLKSWVSAKLLWDPTRDENALVQDFIWGFYGKAAPAIAEYDALLAAAGKDHAKDLASPPGGIRYPMDVSFLSKDFLDKSTEIFARAKAMAKDEPEILKRVERAELPIQYVKLCHGPAAVGPEFGAILDTFDRVARREGANAMEEAGVSYTDRIAAWRKQVPKPTTKQASSEKEMFKIISRGDAAGTYQAFPDACRLKNGEIVCVFYGGYTHISLPTEEWPKGGRICMVRSSDEGKTWSSPAVIFDDENDNRDPHIAQLDDGTLVCTFFSLEKTGDKKYKGLGSQIVRSSDGGVTWETKATSIVKDWYCSAPVRQMADGTCLLGLYREEEGGADKFAHAWGGVTRSMDRGKTWQPPIAIGREANLPLDAETDLIRLNDGTLFAALRSSKINMHYATSSDEGTTWSAVKDIGFKGHATHLNRLSTGEIVLCHRVPNTSIHISRDDAKTWQGPYEIDNVIGAYPSTVELKDHSVLIVYYTEGAGSHIRAKRFRLNTNGIEMLSWT